MMQDGSHHGRPRRRARVARRAGQRAPARGLGGADAGRGLGGARPDQPPVVLRRPGHPGGDRSRRLRGRRRRRCCRRPATRPSSTGARCRRTQLLEDWRAGPGADGRGARAASTPTPASSGTGRPWGPARSPRRGSWRRGPTARTWPTPSASTGCRPPACATSPTSACGPGPSPTPPATGRCRTARCSWPSTRPAAASRGRGATRTPPTGSPGRRSTSASSSPSAGTPTTPRWWRRGPAGRGLDGASPRPSPGRRATGRKPGQFR